MAATTEKAAQQNRGEKDQRRDENALDEFVHGTTEGILRISVSPRTSMFDPRPPALVVASVLSVSMIVSFWTAERILDETSHTPGIVPVEFAHIPVLRRVFLHLFEQRHQ